MKEIDGKNLQQLAMAAAASDPDPEKAVRLLLTWAKANPDQWDSMMEKGGTKAFCRFLVDQARHALRDSYRKPTEPARPSRLCQKGQTTKSKLSRAATRAAAAATNITGWLADMIGSKRMADCTRKDLMDSAKAHMSSSLGSLKECRYREMVAAGLRGGQKVADRYTNEGLEAIMKAAEKEVYGKKSKAG